MSDGGYQGYYQQPMGPKPDNYLVWAILSTLMCCQPFGIVSIVFAAQVDSKYAAGDYAGAVDCSEKARTWAIASAGVALALFALGFILWLVLVVAAASS